MNELKSYAIFAETVSSGSMSAAARRLGMTPSAVSQAIRALERQTGVTLLIRSTRKLTLTEAGRRCYPHCIRLLEASNAASQSLIQARDAPTGELRIAAPLGFAPYIAPALAPVLTEWPKMSLSLTVDDAMVDLVEQRIDIAIRVGQLADSNWIARKLSEFKTLLCASPSYLEQHGTPLSPSELSAHQWIALSRDIQESSIFKEHRPTVKLEMTNPQGDTEFVTVEARITSTNQVTLRQMCEHGMGIARLVYPDIRPALDSGALVRVLPHWVFPRLPVTMITQRREGEAAKVRVAMAALKRYFASLELPTEYHRQQILPTSPNNI